MLMFVRYNFNHFRGLHPGVVQGDHLMAQRLETMEMLARSLSGESPDSLKYLSPLFDDFRE